MGVVTPASTHCNAHCRRLTVRGVHVLRPCDISLRLPSRESGNRFLPLMGRQLAGPAELHTTAARPHLLRAGKGRFDVAASGCAGHSRA